jgi:hypothetical protein
MNVCVVLTVAMVNAVKGFLAVWDNIYDCLCTTLVFSVIRDG